MKRVLIVINHMNIGGIQTALLQLLRKIEGKYEIDFLSLSPGGELLHELPAYINVLEPSKALIVSEGNLKDAAKYGALWQGMRAICSLWAKLFSKRIPAYVVTKFMQKKIGDYDVAISYTQPSNSKIFFNLSNEVVLNSCSAKRKITFVHCDYLNYGGNDACNRSLYKRFDKVATVSRSVGKRIVEAIPEINNKIITVRNCFDVDRIRYLSNDTPVQYTEKISVVTVARLSKEKGLLRCIPIFKRLAEAGHDVRWHIIGDGPEKELLSARITEMEADGLVVLHGKQSNPYRYMKNANLFLLPSFHEAAPVVYDEARALDIPVITTNTTSAIEMIENVGAGWVCDVCDDAIYEMLSAYCNGHLHLVRAVTSELDAPIEQFISALEA